MTKDSVKASKTLLEKFNLSFEYDMTWHEAKKAIKARTDA